MNAEQEKIFDTLRPYIPQYAIGTIRSGIAEILSASTEESKGRGEEATPEGGISFRSDEKLLRVSPAEGVWSEGKVPETKLDIRSTPPQSPGVEGETDLEKKVKEVVEGLYHELIYAVGSKYPDESRHQTALRYIRSAERGSGACQAADQSPTERKDEK